MRLKDARITIRLTTDERASIERRAKAARVTVGALLRLLSAEHAERAKPKKENDK